MSIQNQLLSSVLCVVCDAIPATVYIANHSIFMVMPRGRSFASHSKDEGTQMGRKHSKIVRADSGLGGV